MNAAAAVGGTPGGRKAFVAPIPCSPLRPSCLQYFPFLSFMGGNSTKATSGINGAGTQAQQELGIPDSAKIFFEDTKRSVSAILPCHAR